MAVNYNFPLLPVTFTPGATLEQYQAVVQVDENVVDLCSSGDMVLGSAVEDRNPGFRVDVVIAGVYGFLASGTIAVGDEITGDNGGYVRTATDSDTKVLGIALSETNYENDICYVQITKYRRIVGA